MSEAQRKYKGDFRAPRAKTSSLQSEGEQPRIAFDGGPPSRPRPPHTKPRPNRPHGVEQQISRVQHYQRSHFHCTEELRFRHQQTSSQWDAKSVHSVSGGTNREENKGKQSRTKE